jgi:fission process protein 1
MSHTEPHHIHNDKGQFDSTDSNMRYLAYLRPIAPLTRYAAYCSDLGEAFRPIVSKWLVRGTYAISWGYVLGDVTYTGYIDHKKGIQGNELYRNVAQRTVFQSFASMIFPAITIHTVVHQSKRLFKSQAWLQKYVKWGPTFCGLGIVPFLPFMYDHPVETATEYVFDKVWKIDSNKQHES